MKALNERSSESTWHMVSTSCRSLAYSPLKPQHLTHSSVEVNEHIIDEEMVDVKKKSHPPTSSFPHTSYPGLFFSPHSTKHLLSRQILFLLRLSSFTPYSDDSSKREGYFHPAPLFYSLIDPVSPIVFELPKYEQPQTYVTKPRERHTRTRTHALHNHINSMLNCSGNLPLRARTLSGPWS